uniref:Uncharacterized protein n=2 Tax=Lygus hesperus TaxID=30085 RepID=A0A0K8S7M8_LYGHE
MTRNMFLIKKESRSILHQTEVRSRIILNMIYSESQSRNFSRKGRDDEEDGKDSKKKPKGKSPNQGYWDDNYDTDQQFGKKVESDLERLTRMGEKEADPKDMDVNARIEGEARPTRTWLGVGPGAPKGKKNKKDDED